MNNVPTLASLTPNPEPCTNSSEVTVKNVSPIPSFHNQGNLNCLNFDRDILSNTERAIDNVNDDVLNEVDNIENNVRNLLFQ